MNFLRDLLGSSQTAEKPQPPGYPRTPAYPSSSPSHHPARSAGRSGGADEDQWSVDVVEKPVSVASNSRPGVKAHGIGSKCTSVAEQQRREEEAAAERARQEAELARRRQLEEEERRRQEEEEAKNSYGRVQLAMYDLSGGLVQYVPAALLSGAKFDGIWHTGVRVFDKEYWFGGGVFENELNDSPFGTPVRVERLGKTDRTHEELLDFIRDEVIRAYNSSTYHFLSRNCNHFSSEVVQFLLAGRHVQGPLEEVLEQPNWCYNHSLSQLLIPAMNKWLGGFGAEDVAMGRKPQVKHMTRAEKEQEQRRVSAQWAEWVQEKNRQWQRQLEERRREDEDDEFQNWMLDQHQKMENEEIEAKKRAERDAEKQRQARQLEELIKAQEQYDAEERHSQQQRKAQEHRFREQQQAVAEEQTNHQQQTSQRQREVEQTLRDILNATKQGADAAVLEWALAEAKEAGLQTSAPFLIRDAEYVLRERT
mmetsp:Transcript_87918/g.138788  ORF Transcript_87918/g.138788 Transcript_87918/m.138788 type:complete len:479 (-) Transcript_87918:85-1521(-)